MVWNNPKMAPGKRAEECVKVLERAVALFEQVLSNLGLSICSMYLSHQTIQALKPSVTVAGLAPMEHLKQYGHPLFNAASFTPALVISK
jgi:hypothetical protein